MDLLAYFYRVCSSGSLREVPILWSTFTTSFDAVRVSEAGFVTV